MPSSQNGGKCLGLLHVSWDDKKKQKKHTVSTKTRLFLSHSSAALSGYKIIIPTRPLHTHDNGNLNCGYQLNSTNHSHIHVVLRLIFPSKPSWVKDKTKKKRQLLCPDCGGLRAGISMAGDAQHTHSALVKGLPLKGMQRAYVRPASITVKPTSGGCVTQRFSKGTVMV